MRLMKSLERTSVQKFSLVDYPIFYVLLFIIFTCAQFWPGSVNDGSRMATVESLLERKVFWTDQSMYRNYNDSVFHKGHFYSDKQPLLSLYTAGLLLPVHALYTFGSETGRFTLYYLAVVTSS